jgi:hypothetical protein
VRRLTLGAVVASGAILTNLSAVIAQEQATPPTTSAGNLPADFYVANACNRPEAFSVPKPLATDRDGVLMYNNAIKHHNERLNLFGACINAYVEKASRDIDWILFTVNSAVAKANNSNPPSAPTAAGNMPLGFYPSPECIKPSEPSGTIPSVHDTKAMDAHNAEVKAYNALAAAFMGCINGYAARAQTDIKRIESAQKDAASQTKAQ